MPRRKSLVAVIRERLREEARNAIQSLLGGMFIGTRATSGRRRRKERGKRRPGGPSSPPRGVAYKAAQNKNAAVTPQSRERERAAMAGVALVLAGERAPFADLRAPSVAHDEWFCGWYERLAMGPGAATAMYAAMFESDMPHVLPPLRVPTRVRHRSRDHHVRAGRGRYLAEHVRAARYIELPAENGLFHLGDAETMRREIEEFFTGTRSAPESGRMLATVLFTDIVGSTERAAALGDAAWRGLLDAHHEVVRRELERYRGQEIGTTGDGFLATFARPARAIRCAGAVAQAVRHLGIDVRAGLHTGEVEYVGESLAGIAVHTAARVAALAGPGEVLVSSTVKDLVAGSGLRFADRGTYALKGFPDEWRLFAVEQ